MGGMAGKVFVWTLAPTLLTARDSYCGFIRVITSTRYGSDTYCTPAFWTSSKR